jgi:hypothetical protein
VDGDDLLGADGQLYRRRDSLMAAVRLALANIRRAATPDESVALARAAIEQTAVAEEWFVQPTGHINVCHAPLPVRAMTAR